MLAFKIAQSTPQDWFGKSTRKLHDADMWRFTAAQTAAKKFLNSDKKQDNSLARAQLQELLKGQ